MSNEDFTDDSKDAGEIGAGQTITALYEIVPRDTTVLPEGWDNGVQVATFDFRYKRALGEQSAPIRLAVNEWVGSSSENLNFAAGVAAYGMLLRKSPYAGNATYSLATKLVEENKSFDPHGYRSKLVDLINKASGMAK